MNRVIAWLKQIRLVQLLRVFLASVFMFFASTACSSQVLAKTADQIRPEVPKGAVTSTYKGGMNDYSDIDPRDPKVDSTKLEAQTNALVKNAEQNLNRRAENPQELGRNYRQGAPLGERVQRLADNVRDRAENLAEGVSGATQKGTENLKRNTGNTAEDVAKSAKRSTEDVKDNIQAAGQDLSKNTQRAAADASDFISRQANQGAKYKERAMRDAADAID
ncbi:MAG TPA: hypothetical protein DDZ80_06710 [Cyanobacteria bacterium UBA8803]|nr:hypothetical protein [Cyanobacteria bacterium UBA9273]HBL58214.1 hypothetical protein [Cyanobacteria bacterium UBA8803]